MDPTTFALGCLASVTAILGLVVALFALHSWRVDKAVAQEARAGAAELALMDHLRGAAAALAASRLDALNEAKLLLVSRARSAQEDVDRAAALDAALASAPPGDELLAVERLLQARAGARREGPSQPPGAPPASGDGPGDTAVDGDGEGLAPRA